MSASRLTAFVLLGAAVVACGGQTAGPGGGTGSVSGSVAGTSFQAASVVATIAPFSSETTCPPLGVDSGQSCVTTDRGQLVAVVLTNRADANCAFVRSQAASDGAMIFASSETTSSSYATGPALGATSGTITLTQAGPGEVAGSYTVTFGTIVSMGR